MEMDEEGEQEGVVEEEREDRCEHNENEGEQELVK